mmetsp:Transcript_50639/g.101113  ORF Transcript_50639/g.101113 Transcript_50639/m.101113 type:complete len:243 (-) Transcript_50639:55-783(-)
MDRQTAQRQESKPLQSSITLLSSPEALEARCVHISGPRSEQLKSVSMSAFFRLMSPAFRSTTGNGSLACFDMGCCRCVASCSLRCCMNGRYMQEGDEMSEEQLSSLHDILTGDQRWFGAGQTLELAGQRMYMHILQGVLTVRSEDNSVLEHRTKGDLALDAGFLYSSTMCHHASVVAETDVVVSCVPSETVDHVAFDEPVVGASIFRALSLSLLKHSQQQIQEIMVREKQTVAHSALEQPET